MVTLIIPTLDLSSESVNLSLAETRILLNHQVRNAQRHAQEILHLYVALMERHMETSATLILLNVSVMAS